MKMKPCRRCGKPLDHFGASAYCIECSKLLKGERDDWQKPVERSTTLFDAISHGSEEHRAWLKKAIEDHFAGRPVEAPRG